MLGAACYANRYGDLLKGFCGGSLGSGCDWKLLREHFDAVGRAENRKWGCEGVTANELNHTGATAIADAFEAPHSYAQKPIQSLPEACQQYHRLLDSHAASLPREPHPLHHELHPSAPLPGRRCPAWPIEMRSESRRRTGRRLLQQHDGTHKRSSSRSRTGGSTGGGGGSKISTKTKSGGKTNRVGLGRSSSDAAVLRRSTQHGRLMKATQSGGSGVGGTDDVGGGRGSPVPNGGGAAQLRAEMTELAEHWLLPFAGGIDKEHAHPPSQKGDKDLGGDEWRMCSLIQVVGGRIYLKLSPRALLTPRLNFSSCGHTDSENGRTLVMLRLLRLALMAPYPHRPDGTWPDFEFRLCADDFCHGLAENANRAFFTQSVCQTLRTLPSVQWNPSGGRDVDLALWDETMARRRRLRQLHADHWGCRLPVAIWRGDAHNHFVYNERWNVDGYLSRQRMRPERWTTQGRLALVHQKCTHRSRLNVRVKLLTPGGRYGPFLWDNHNGTPPDMKAYAACVKSINGDKPKVVPMPEQGARFQMAVHVEGNGGWADRLRHLLLSGMVVLKQDMGVGEWWEWGLTPWVHFVPVSATLHNLTDAIDWVRDNSSRASQIAADAAAFVERRLSTRALEAYGAALFRGFARLYRAPPPVLEKHHTQRFECALTHGVPGTHSDGTSIETYSTMDCGFVAHIGAGRASASTPRSASLVELYRMRGALPAKPACVGDGASRVCA